MFKKLIAWLFKKQPDSWKAKQAEVAVDRWANKKEPPEVVPPTHKFIDAGTGERLGRGKKSKPSK